MDLTAQIPDVTVSRARRGANRGVKTHRAHERDRFAAHAMPPLKSAVKLHGNDNKPKSNNKQKQK